MTRALKLSHSAARKLGVLKQDRSAPIYQAPKRETVTGIYTPLVFVLPLPANLLNDRKHWRAKHREMVEWQDECDERQCAGLLPPPPRQAFSGIVASAVLYVAQEMDDDNAFVRCAKWPLDWLKTRGYITDDTRRHVRWTALPDQIVGKRADQRLVLTVTPR